MRSITLLPISPLLNPAPPVAVLLNMEFLNVCVSSIAKNENENENIRETATVSAGL